MSHSTRPRPADAFASKNRFRLKSYQSKNIRNLSDAMLMLPSPDLPGYPVWEEMYWRAWGLAWSNLRRPNPSSGFVSNFPSAIGENNIQMWESAFMTQLGIYGRRAFDFMGALDNFYAKQHGDGFICREISTESGLDLFHPFDPNSTGPHILAWAEWRHYRLSGDDSRLSEVIWPLLALHRWIRSNRSWPRGLYWSTSLSSGMGNQVRVPGGRHHHRHWSWVDATMQAAVDARVLAKMAKITGEDEAAESLRNEHLNLVEDINRRLWNESEGFYQDIDTQGRFSQVKSSAAYWALLDKEVVPPDRLESFLSHLRNENVFKRPHRIPVLAADAEDYSQNGDYWRGGVWSPINFMLLKGLTAYKKHRLAHEIAVNHLNQMAEVFEHTDTFWEYYSPESAGPGPGAKPHYVGWTGLSAINILIEDVIGIQVDWPLREVIWERQLDCDEPYGVRNLPLGIDGALSLTGDNQVITIESTSPFTLTVRDPNRQVRKPVSAGTTELVWD